MRGFGGHNAGFPDPDWQASERWGRTWDPSGARRPRGPQLALRGLSTTAAFAALALLAVMCREVSVMRDADIDGREEPLWSAPA